MNFFARLKIECRKLNARYNGNAVALADYLASYRAGYAVMVRYGNSVYSAFCAITIISSIPTEPSLNFV